MPRTLLLTLGRLPKGLDIARAFHAAGWRVLVAEPFRWHLTGQSRAVARSFQVTAPAVDHAAYLAEIADIARRESVDLVVPVSEETMHVAHLRGALPAGTGLFTMPPEVVLALHDKHGFIGRARGQGLAVPDTVMLGDAAGAAMAAAGDVVVKPIFSCSGRGVQILRHGANLPAPAVDTPMVVQRFVPGAVLSTCSIAQGGRVAATVVYCGGIMSGTVAVSFQRVERQAAVEAWVEQFVRAEGYTGFISFDFVLGADGVAYAIECNPRATSGLHFIAPADLVACVLNTSPGAVARMRPNAHMQQFYAALTETQSSVTHWARFRANLRMLLQARDVTWDIADPWPFISMPFTSWKIISMAAKRRVSFGEVATLEVGWYG